MGRQRTLSMTAFAVLKAIDAGYRYGFDIMDATELPSGTVYPSLSRLERDGLVTAAWEDPGLARRSKRPPRKYYELTDTGARALERAVSHYRMIDGLEPAPEAETVDAES